MGSTISAWCSTMHHRHLAAQLDERVHDFLHDGGRKALERLIEQDQFARHHQRARDRDHLAFAARQVLGLGGTTFAQARE